MDICLLFTQPIEVHVVCVCVCVSVNGIAMKESSASGIRVSATASVFLLHHSAFMFS